MKRISDLSRISDLAFLIGNGINRYPDDPKDRSWENVLKTIYETLVQDSVDEVPQGIHLTEFYEIIVLKHKLSKHPNEKIADIRNEFIKNLDNWKINGTHYAQIISKIKELNAPVMTTNFDDLLEQASNSKIFWTMTDRRKNFTSHYPWESYYSDKVVDDPFNNFSIWHLQGQKYYVNSIKLGIRHYLKMFARAEKWLPAKKPEDTQKRYFDTWLHIFFEKNLFIFGIGLEEQELFLRWLLLERERYFRRSPSNRKKGWYVFIEEIEKNNLGKKFYLENLGIEYIEFDTKKSFYEDFWKS